MKLKHIIMFIILIIIFPFNFGQATIDSSSDSNSDGNTEIDSNSDNIKIYQEDILLKIKLLKKYINPNEAQLISKHMQESILKHNLSINIVLSLAYLESRFNQKARGKKNEIGMMQIMPYWKRRALCKDMQLWYVQNNIECGCRILHQYTDELNDEIYGVAAYNMGPENAKRIRDRKINLKKSWYMRMILNSKKILDSYDNKKLK